MKSVAAVQMASGPQVQANLMEADNPNKYSTSSLLYNDQLNKGAGITSMEIDLDELHATRKKFPVLEHCCPAGALSP